METRTFDLLSPALVFDAIESAYGLHLYGTPTAYPSYVNRVYGIGDEDGGAYVAKFYRPGRWSAEAILEEHRFVLDCVEDGLPVVAPLPSLEGTTLARVSAEDESGSEDFFFSLSPKRSGRSFDAESDEDWMRLGAIVGRIHAVGARHPVQHRLRCTPGASTAAFVEQLRAARLVPPGKAEELYPLVEEALRGIAPLFEGVALQRIHGDCHRGNILDRRAEGLLIIDFDDMMEGPAVQDLWLLLPDHARQSQRELSLILEGYEQFRGFDATTLALIEPLRLMRILYFLAWAAGQRNDHGFRSENPGWGTEAFWTREIEDIRSQLAAIEAGRSG
jgi:Ser/Thr protein kinase RdoA (MazF antagonist)